MRCEVGDVSFSYETVGEGRPVLVLHGISLDSSVARFEFEPAFAGRQGWQRVYVDLPGHGATRGGESFTTFEPVLDALEGLCDSVFGDARVVLAGSSFGGYLARGLVHRLGGRVDGLCMNVPGVFHGAFTTPPRRIVAGEPAIREKAGEEGWAWYAELAVADSASTREYGEAVRQAVCDGAYLGRFLDKGTAVACSFDHETLPSPFPAPTLVMAGRQDHICGYADAWTLLESYPRATYAVLDRAGHLLRGEQPALFTALVSEWLDRVEEWVAT